MESFMNFISTHNIDLWYIVKVGGLMLIGLLLLGAIGRFAFGKRSVLNGAVSSAIGILFIYVVTVLVKQFWPELEIYLSPLPFVTISGDQMQVFSFMGADYLAISAELLSMVILSFLVNLADGWLPHGKNVISWFFFRCLTVVLAIIMHLVATALLHAFLPQGILQYAPVILLAILLVMLLTGALKVVIGAVLTTVNPIIAALYTFFFANFVGKQVTKAVLTTLILSGIVLALNYAQIAVVSIASAMLVAYLPFLLILILLWYLVYRIL